MELGRDSDTGGQVAFFHKALSFELPVDRVVCYTSIIIVFIISRSLWS